MGPFFLHVQLSFSRGDISDSSQPAKVFSEGKISLNLGCLLSAVQAFGSAGGKGAPWKDAQHSSARGRPCRMMSGKDVESYRPTGEVTCERLGGTTERCLIHMMMYTHSFVCFYAQASKKSACRIAVCKADCPGTSCFAFVFQLGTIYMFTSFHLHHRNLTLPMKNDG